MSQAVDLLAGSYDVSFQAAQSAANAKAQGQQIEVLVDGAQVASITPSGASYGLYETANFMVTPQQAATATTIEFMGTNLQGGNNAALIDLASLTASPDEITDGGFEVPVLAANSYQVGPSGTPWQFNGLAGMSANGSGLTSGNNNAPQGAQVGYLINNASMSYSVYLDADTYSLSFLAAQRVNHQAQSQQIRVLLDGAQVALVTPSGASYTLYQTANFTVAAGMHTVQFVGLTNPPSGYSTAFLDDVAVAAVENSLSDGGFEAPVLAAHSYAIAPGGSGWQFSGLAGISNNGSAFTEVNKGTLNAPGGTQVAFIKDNGSMSQTVNLEAGTYYVSFLAAPRVNYQTQQIAVLVNGRQVALITPVVAKTAASTASNTTYTYTPCQTPNFVVAAGPHTIEFLGMTPATSDSTDFIDNATINAGCGIIDGSFEEPVLAAASYAIAPGGTAWQFAGLAGVSTNQSGFTVGNPNAPNGNQVAFIKDDGSMSQSVDLDAGVYNLSFMAAQRDKYQSQYAVARDPGRWPASGHGHARRHHLWPVRDVEFQRGGGGACHSVRRG